jgi:hypothetical protein
MPLSLTSLTHRRRSAWLTWLLWLWLGMGWAIGQWAMLVHPVAHSSRLGSLAANDFSVVSIPGQDAASSSAPAVSHWWDVLLGHRAHSRTCHSLDSLGLGSAVAPTPTTPVIEWLSGLFYFFTSQEASLGLFIRAYWATGPPLSHL